MSSTGVIGSPLPKQKIIDGANSFNLSAKNGEAFIFTMHFEPVVSKMSRLAAFSFYYIVRTFTKK